MNVTNSGDRQKMYYDNLNNNNDIGFNNGIDFEDNTYFNNNPTFNNSIDYLDSFYNDCLNNKEIHNAVVKKNTKKSNLSNKIKIISLMISFTMIIVGSNLDIYILVTIGTIGCMAVIFGLLIAEIVFTPNKNKTKKTDDNQQTDNIHYDYLKEYLKLEKLNNFSDEKPRCLTLPNTFYEDKPEDVTPVLIIGIIFILAGLLISYIKFGNAWDRIMVCSFLLLFGGIGLGFLGFGVIGRIRRSKAYDEIVDAACIEVNIERHRSVNNNGGGPSYRPVFFTKCRNGQKYILYNKTFTNFSVPRVGDIIQLKVNSINPFQWIRKDDRGAYAFFTVMGLGFAACGLGTYIWILMSA